MEIVNFFSVKIFNALELENVVGNFAELANLKY